MRDFTEIVRLYRSRPNESFALATLVRASGSSYRRPGARMLIASDGMTAGSLSAGCLEDEVALAAIDVIKTGESRLMSFDTRRRFGCNGSIDIRVERVSENWLRELAENVGARRSFTLRTTRFEHRIEPPIRLLIIGSGPDSVALRAQANLLGWQVLVVESIAEWRGEIDAQTAAVIATHNYGRDCAALRHLLSLGLRYVGVIGPRRRRDELLIDVLDTGAPITSELFAPAGLDVAAETPAEIALAIATEIQSTFAGGTGESLRDSKLPIHHESSRDHPGRGRVDAVRAAETTR